MVLPQPHRAYETRPGTSPVHPAIIGSEGGDSNFHGLHPSVFKTNMSRLIPSPSDIFKTHLKDLNLLKYVFTELIYYPKNLLYMSFLNGANEENRTPIQSLQNFCSTIELH